MENSKSKGNTNSTEFNAKTHLKELVVKRQKKYVYLIGRDGEQRKFLIDSDSLKPFNVEWLDTFDYQGVQAAVIGVGPDNDLWISFKTEQVPTTLVSKFVVPNKAEYVKTTGMKPVPGEDIPMKLAQDVCYGLGIPVHPTILKDKYW
eukprot:TRINITY_DN14617_c0_g1_i1.p1 TRINITY_DN14617_c0_g1~~TRINITY_DN14617_c0_g1_i1.p1  ORF type:complete len:147 (-),score=16.02 TRINITY_DN14617_c0_g1_i1:46-486(-)